MAKLQKAIVALVEVFEGYAGTHDRMKSQRVDKKTIEQPYFPAMSKLEKAIVSIVEVFEEYAGAEEKKGQLSDAELSELIKNQLSSPGFQDKIDKKDIQEALTNIDKNHDGQVNFREFSQCVALLAKGYYRKKHG